MGVLSVNDLKEGMVLASEIKNRHGNVLLQKGDALEEKHIMRLKSWGITEVDIEGVDRDQVEKREMEVLSSDLIASVEEELDGLFPDYGDNALMKEVYRVVKKCKLKKVAEESSAGSNENN